MADEELGMAALTADSAPSPVEPASKEPKGEKNKKKSFLTRGNLIVLGLVMLFSFLMIFTGFCITDPSDTTPSFVSSKNPLSLLRQAMNLQGIRAQVPGQIANILVAVYISLFVFAFIFEYRFAIVRKKKWYAAKMWVIYILTLAICVALSYGLGLLIQSPLDAQKVSDVSTFIGESLLISGLVYLLVGLLVGAILLSVVNALRYSKPLGGNDALDEESDPDNDIAKGLGEGSDANAFKPAAAGLTPGSAGAGAGGAGGAGYGGTGGGAGGAGGAGGGLTSFGESALADREIVFPALSTIDKIYGGNEADPITSDEITLGELCVRFRNFLAAKEKLYYELDTLRFFISGMAASHLEILEGLSGTGKSSLPRAFAKFVNGHSIFLAVQATWRDKTNLIGYFNDFSKTYAETDFLLNLYEASYNPDRIYMFVLDEMNISRIEYYFADFLSILEYPADQWKLRVMQLPFDFVPPVKLDKGFVRIPQNVYFIGTANQDDSTFSIADKVYDRAITIAFDNRNVAFVPEGESDPIMLTAPKFASLLEEAKNDPSYAFTPADLKKLAVITDYVYEEFGVAFGNRILNQIENIVPTFISCGGKKEDALDFILMRKVLAKLEGRFEDNVKPGLEHILQLLDETYGEHTFRRCEHLIEGMLKKL